MATAFEIPTVPLPQAFSVALGGVTYNMTLDYHEANGGQSGEALGADIYVPGSVIDTNVLDSWILNIADSANNPIISGIPLVAGTDLLGQFAYLGFGGSLICGVDGDPSGNPSFDGLGSTGHLYFVILP